MRELMRHHRTVLLLATGVVVLAAMAGFLLVRQGQHGAEQPGISVPEGNAQQLDQQSSSSVMGANPSTIIIQEWGVQIKPDAQLGTLSYRPAPGNPDMLGLTTDTAGALDPGCNLSGTEWKAPLGILQRSQEPLKVGGVTRPPLKVLGGYYYYFTGPQSVCLDNPASNEAAAEIAGQQALALSRSMLTLEPTP